MEFNGIGVIPYEAPLEQLRPFFKKKYKTWFRTCDSDHDGVIRIEDLNKEAEEILKGFPGREEEMKVKIEEKWDFVFLCGKERTSVTEEQAVNLWIGKVFADKEDRKKEMERTKVAAHVRFEWADINKSGAAEYDEWRRAFCQLESDAIKTLFDATDINKDGMVSLEEWQYAIVSFHLCSGPDSPYSLLFGAILDMD